MELPSRLSPKIMELPTELMTEIFYKLPIKSICRSKWVCKDWYNILTSPYFIDNYFKNTPYHAVLFFKDSLYSCHLVEISDDDADHIQTRIYLKLPAGWPTPDPEFTQVRIEGSYKGFLCVSGVIQGLSRFTSKVGLCNPITQEFVALPQCEISLPWNAAVMYIFGQTLTHRFKILRIVYKPRKSMVQILTVGGDNEWRSLPSELGSQILPGVTFNGIHHWKQPCCDFEAIQTFDLGEEKLGSISCHPDMHLGAQCSLEVISNRLCMLDYQHSQSRHPEITMWTLKEYGVADSWTKTVILRSWFPHDPASALSYLSPIAEHPSGGLLFAYQLLTAAKSGFYLSTRITD